MLIKIKEAALQKSIVQYLTLKKVLFWHTPNGGYRHEMEAARFKTLGVRAGVPDIFIPLPKGSYHGFFCELKSDKGRVTFLQKEMINNLIELGYYCCICKSFEEFEREYLKYVNCF